MNRYIFQNRTLQDIRGEAVTIPNGIWFVCDKADALSFLVSDRAQHIVIVKQQ